MSAPTYRLDTLCIYYAPRYGVSYGALMQYCQQQRYSLKGRYTRAKARELVFKPWAEKHGRSFKTSRGSK